MSKRNKTNNEGLWDRACKDVGINVNRREITNPSWSKVNSRMIDIIWDIQKSKKVKSELRSIEYKIPPDCQVIDDKTYAEIPEDAVSNKESFFGYKLKNNKNL